MQRVVKPVTLTPPLSAGETVRPALALAEHLGAVPNGQVLMIHSQSGALDMPRHYQPDVAIVVRSLVATGGRRLLSDLIKEVRGSQNQRTDSRLIRRLKYGFRHWAYKE